MQVCVDRLNIHKKTKKDRPQLFITLPDVHPAVLRSGTASSPPSYFVSFLQSIDEVQLITCFITNNVTWLHLTPCLRENSPGAKTLASENQRSCNCGARGNQAWAAGPLKGLGYSMYVWARGPRGYSIYKPDV